MGKSKPTVTTPWLLEKVLFHRIQQTFGDSTPSVDQIVHRLRQKHPEYRRHNCKRFTRMVTQSLNLNNSNVKQKSNRNEEASRFPFTYDDDEDDNTSPSLLSPVCKKAKKFDNREPRSQMLETNQVAQRRIELKSSSKSSSSDDGGEDRSAVSTTDDEVETEFDLTKSILRNKYSGLKSDAADIMKIDRGVKPKQSSNNSSSNGGFDASETTNNGNDGGMRFKDLGGMDVVLKELTKSVILPLLHPELLLKLGVGGATPPTLGILLHGPPGCGKTTLVHALANEAGFPLHAISATELVSGISGASEENIRELFSKAYRKTPSIVFIDEIDIIGSKRDNVQKPMETRMVTQLMKCMEQPHDSKSLETSTNNKSGHVLVIGATNRPDALDPGIRRTGRFDHEIHLGVPDENARFQILKVVTRDLTLEGDIDLMKIARMTPGFVAADLKGLVNEAVIIVYKRIFDERELELSKENVDWHRKEFTMEELKNCSFKMSDLELAAKRVECSSKREGFSSIPNIKWEDVGGLDKLRREFDRYIIRRIKYPNQYEKYGVNLETGFLLYGPPGCGKTLIAKAVANEAGANFIHIKGPELLNKFVGESELAVRTIFSRARTCSPCILFFDEVDALTTKRGKEGGWVVGGLLNQLLVELDGADQRKGVYVIGATNRPEVMDQALLRPGRFGKLLYVPLPNGNERGLILKALGRMKPLDADVDLIAIGRSEACSNFSGADLSALMNEAAMAAVEEKFNKIEAGDEGGLQEDTIKAIHFEQVMGTISPSVSDKQNRYYHRLSQSFGAS